MNRKSFIRYTVPLALGFGVSTSSKESYLERFIFKNKFNNKIIILIQLNGGNDGLNTVIPIDKYNILSCARKNILIPEKKVLQLNDNNIFGFHPSLEALQRLYNERLLCVIQGVGYKNPEFSHFEGINIKYTATVGRVQVRSGWLGRYLEQEYPKYPEGYPKKNNDGPPAMRVGIVSPKITQGIEEDYSVGVTKLSDFTQTTLVSNADNHFEGYGGQNINIIKAISKQIDLYAPIIQKYSKMQDNKSKLYPEAGKNVLADQLKVIARLIGSGLDTKVYLVSQTGYDTHAEQVEPSDTTKGKHANLLKDLSDAIMAFEDDLHLMGKQDDVIGMTFSEFGRRIVSSGSYGTDHGTAESVIMFGSKLKGGIIGSSPDLPSKVDVEDNLPMQVDFRALYASVLKGWFGVEEQELKKIIFQGPTDRLDLFKA